MQNLSRRGDSEAAQLTEAFLCFNDVSRRLSHCYGQLEAQVEGLSQSLARERAERLAEEAGKERLAQRLERVLKALPAGVVVLDGDGRVEQCNPAAERLLGAGVLGAAWRDLVQARFQPRADDGPDISLRSGQRVNIDTCSLGAEPGQILLIRDVTETRELQDQLARLQRLSEIGRMAASLAHQIRTPLSCALLYAASLKHRPASPADGAGAPEKIVESLRHLESLVTNMLAFAGRGDFEIESIDVDDLLASVERLMGRGIDEAGGSLEVQNAARGALVHGNKAALSSALQNLVSNALQAGGPGTRVRIDARPGPRDTLCIIVADNGPGIEPAVRRRVFEPFYSTRDNGTGLGLAIVQGVVEAHGGDIRLDPDASSGAVFRIHIPGCVFRTQSSFKPSTDSGSDT